MFKLIQGIFFKEIFETLEWAYTISRGSFTSTTILCSEAVLGLSKWMAVKYKHDCSVKEQKMFTNHWYKSLIIYIVKSSIIYMEGKLKWAYAERRYWMLGKKYWIWIHSYVSLNNCKLIRHWNSHVLTKHTEQSVTQIVLWF